MFIAIKKAAEKSAPDFQLGPHFEGIQWPAMQILARMCDLWLDLLSRKRTLRDQLTSVSRLSHLYLACYRQNGTSFLPAQNYRSTQSMNMAVFHTVVCCQLEGIDEYWLTLDDDDRLGNNFNVLRMMFGNGQNFDQLQHEQRQSGAMQLSDIYARKPHLYKGAKHRAVQSSPDDISTLDHSNPKHYLYDNGVPKPERVQVATLSVPTCWLIGRQQAQKDLAESAFKPSSVDFVALAAVGQIDMLRPLGKWVGVSNEPSSDEPAVATAARPSHAESSHIGGSVAGASATDASHIESSHAAANHIEGSIAEASATDASHTESSRAAASHIGASVAGASTTDASHTGSNHAAANHIGGNVAVSSHESSHAGASHGAAAGALREFEGALSDGVARLTGNRHMHKQCLYDVPESVGKPVSIHTTIKEVFAGEVRSNASDRGARVRDDTKPGYATRVSGSNVPAYQELSIRARVDLLFALVNTSNGVTVALLMPTLFTIGSTKSTEVAPERLENAQIVGSIALLRPQSGQNLSWQPVTVDGEDQGVGEQIVVASEQYIVCDPNSDSGLRAWYLSTSHVEVHLLFQGVTNGIRLPVEQF